MSAAQKAQEEHSEAPQSQRLKIVSEWVGACGGGCGLSVVLGVCDAITIITASTVPPQG